VQYTDASISTLAQCIEPSATNAEYIGAFISRVVQHTGAVSTEAQYVDASLVQFIDALNSRVVQHTGAVSTEAQCIDASISTSAQ
jgi:hypothetical protein